MSHTRIFRRLLLNSCSYIEIFDIVYAAQGAWAGVGVCSRGVYVGGLHGGIW